MSKSEKSYKNKSVKFRLPRNLGPRAKHQLICNSAKQNVLCTVEIASNLTPTAIKEDLNALEVTIRYWSSTTHLLTVELPANRLLDLAVLKDIIFVELAQQYTP